MGYHYKKKTKEKENSDIVGSKTFFTIYPAGNNSYSVDQEIFNSYGRKENADLLLYYGFALENNEWETTGVDYIDLSEFASKKNIYQSTAKVLEEEKPSDNQLLSQNKR